MFCYVTLFSMKPLFNRNEKKPQSLTVISMYKNLSQNAAESYVKICFVLFCSISHSFSIALAAFFLLILVLPKKSTESCLFLFFMFFSLKESKFPISFYQLWQRNGKVNSQFKISNDQARAKSHFFRCMILV